MSQVPPAHEILDAIFGVIIRAAEKDAAFAQELMQALEKPQQHLTHAPQHSAPS